MHFFLKHLFVTLFTFFVTNLSVFSALSTSLDFYELWLFYIDMNKTTENVKIAVACWCIEALVTARSFGPKVSGLRRSYLNKKL